VTIDFPRRVKRGRMTVSLDPALVAWAKDCARRNDVPVSAVVELALRKARRVNGEEPWRCDWVPDDLNPGPDCPYCAGDMCARLDGLGCTHDREERHGYSQLSEVTPYFKSLVCGVAVCNWSGPAEDFDSHPHRSW
jgi:hypothetical protein